MPPSPPDHDAAAPLDAAVDAYLAHLRVERRAAPRTIALYGRALADLQTMAADDGVALDAAQPHDLRRWLVAQRERGLGPKSLAIVLAAWRGLYRHGARSGWVGHDPLVGLKAPRAPRPLPKALAVDEAQALAEAPPASADPALAARDTLIVELLYGLGLRVGELVALDVAPASSAARTPNGGGCWIDVDDATAHIVGKGSKRRALPVGRAALAALARWRPHREALLRDRAEPALLVTRTGARLSPSQVRTRLAALGYAAGLPARAHPHMLRHSYASHLLQSSGDLRGVQELLGHANIQTTQVYTKLDFQHLTRTYRSAHPRARSAPGRDDGAPPHDE